MPHRRPLTPDELRLAIDSQIGNRLQGAERLIVDAARTPRVLRAPYTSQRWIALPEAERRAHATHVIRGQIFDKLVESRGVLLSGEAR